MRQERLRDSPRGSCVEIAHAQHVAAQKVNKHRIGAVNNVEEPSVDGEALLVVFLGQRQR